MKRRASPPLYELIRTQSGERAVHARQREQRQATDGEPLVQRWLRPGRNIQFPVGYVFVAGAVVILLLAMAYMMGHSRGYDHAKMIQAEELDGAGRVDQRRLPQDPLASDAAAPIRRADLQQPPAATTTSQRENRPSPTRQAGSSEANWGPIDADPRQPGINYFVLATTTADGALRLAEYCRDRGLETYVVSSNNARLRRVIALPGFEAGQRTSRAARAVENLIHRIGEDWKDTEPGATDLRDAYPERHGG